MFNAADVIVGIIATWVIGLAPALFARYLWKKAPLSKRSATWIAGAGCAIFAILFLILRLSLGEVRPRISLAWIPVFLVSRAIMTTGWRADLIERLEAMISDPATTEAGRELAREKLRQLRQMSSSRVPAPKLTVGRPLDFNGAAIGQPECPAPPPSRKKTIPAKLKTFSVADATRRYRRPVAYLLGGALLLDALLIISGYRILLYESIYEPGESYAANGLTYSDDQRAFIACHYWTGRHLKPSLSWYGIGEHRIDECRFLLDPDNES